MNKNLKILIYTALMTAFVFIMTSIIKIPIPFSNGYIHLGDMMIFISGLLLGPLYGAFASGVGSALADLTGGYAHWALPTLLIKGGMGFIIGLFATQKPYHKYLHYSVGLVGLVGTFFAMWYLRNPDMAVIMNEVSESTTLESAFLSLDGLKSQFVSIGIFFLLYTIIIQILKKKYTLPDHYIGGMMLSGIWMVCGYYIASGIMYGSFLVSLFSLPWNIVQFAAGGIIAYFVMTRLNKTEVTYEKLHL